MLSLDPEIQTAMERLLRTSGTRPSFSRGDWQSRRKMIDQSSAVFSRVLVPPHETTVEDFVIDVTGNERITLRLYRKKNSKADAALLYTHGGGKFACSLDSHDPICRYYAASCDVAVLAVDFRLAPEYPFPTSVEDSYAGLCWLAEHAAELGINPHRIGIAGDSGGGGFAAGVALIARDRGGPRLARQILIYPMLDDRNTEPDSFIEPFAFWTYDDNYTGWQCFLGEQAGKEGVPGYAAPSREENLADLPPAFIDVGNLDIFRDESIDYAMRLSRAGVTVELHVYPGAPHGFELIAPDSAVARQAWQARVRAISALHSC